MKSLLSLIALTGLMVSSASAAHQPPLPSVPAPEGEIIYQEGAGEVVEVFHNVRVEDCDNIHPCAVTRIIMVPDPCACNNPCNCCAPACVAVQICVPPCGCERVKISRDGRKHKYDYGKYEVEVTVKNGYVKVDYDD